MTYINTGDTKLVEIAVKELMELQDTGKKVDHPEKGSKDVADAMAGVVYTLMGDRAYRRGVTSIEAYRERRLQADGTTGLPVVESDMPLIPSTGLTGLKAPVPPS